MLDNPSLQAVDALMSLEIEQELTVYLRENFLPQGTDIRIDPEVNLFDTGILDSAAVLSVIFFIESKFGFTIPDEDLLPENISSVAAAARYIARRLNGSNPA